MDLATLIFDPGFQLVLAGAMGGVARVILFRPPLWDSISAVVLGGIVGFYASGALAPGIANALALVGFQVNDDKLPTFASFTTGVGAVTIVGFLAEIGPNRKKLKDAEEAAAPEAPKP